MDEWVCGKCRSINLKFATSCYSCATPRHIAEAAFAQAASAPLGYATPSSGGATPALAGLTGEGAAVASPEAASAGYVFAPAAAQAAGGYGLLGGLLGGLFAAAIATGVWYGVVALTNWQIGLVAVAVGWLVGTGTVLGAGGGASFLLVVSSAIFTLVALAVSEYLIIFHFLSEIIGLSMADLLQPPDVMLQVVIESLTADPLTLVFWAIALFVSVSIPFRALAARA